MQSMEINFKIESRLAIGIRDFRRALLDYEPHILHYIGHGDEKGILLEDKMELPDLFTSKALSSLIENFSKHLECVVLNSCDSTNQAIAIGNHIQYVIGMKREIGDKAAIEFSLGFYDTLGAGKIRGRGL